MSDIPLELAGVTPAVAALVAAIRATGYLPDRHTPLVAIVLGVLGSLLVVSTGTVPMVTAVLGGIMAGAAATGVHQALKRAVTNDI